jgi:hypothetical protein
MSHEAESALVARRTSNGRQTENRPGCHFLSGKCRAATEHFSHIILSKFERLWPQAQIAAREPRTKARLRGVVRQNFWVAVSAGDAAILAFMVGCTVPSAVD